MNKLIPLVIIILQIISFGHLYYTYKYGNSHIPGVFVELNILALFNLTVLLVYFFFFNSKDKQNIWMAPLIVSVITILVLITSYLIMWINKYK